MKSPLIQILFLLLYMATLQPLRAETGNAKDGYTVGGKIQAASNGEAVSFSTVHIELLNMTTVADVDGLFEFVRIPEGEYLLQVTSLGYAPKEVKLKVNKNLDGLLIELDDSSIALPTFNVMAKRTKGDKIVIEESAIEYIQPTSLADIMLLLPGSLYKENDMSTFGQISSRQAGSDANTSLGVAILTDGAPVSNDGYRTQMVGVTDNSTSSSSDSEIRSRTGMNQGVDLRYLSTDHVQSVEFTKGISSAQYGNLSSGLIQVQSKYGATPLKARLKADLKNKLAYAGKGFKLPGKAGTLHLGVDYLHSIDDIREEMDKFNRLTAQAYYNNQIKIGSSLLSLDIKFNQTISLQKMKKDELTYEYDEEYKADYKKTSLLMKGDLALNSPWVQKLELVLSSDVAFDRITRHKMVISSSSVLNVPLAKGEGEYEGAFLPGKYYSDFCVDNIPVNFFVQLNATSRISPGEHFHGNFFYGLEYKNTKNHGDGAVIEDETRPPFPYDNSYMRPRPNYDIPALSVGSAYLQTEFLYINNKHCFKLSPGVRLTRMFNLTDDYALAGKVLVEPRINVFYTFDNGTINNTLRFGYGEENKLPTLDHLYPEKVYKDFYMLNAYNNNAEYRRLITYTYVYDATNKDIRENKNRKIEAGWDIDYKGFSLSLTAFYEKSHSGFEYFKSYSPISYDYYDTSKPKPGIDNSNRLPQKDDYEKETRNTFATYAQVMNSKTVGKRGMEYRIRFPKIKPLQTDVEINGAYYKTNYGSNMPEFYYPGITNMAGVAYPSYLGVYDTQPDYEYRQFNTNFWLNTHIPKYKLIFTNFVQVVWKSSYQNKSLKEVYPYAYVDFAGNVHPVTQVEIDKMNSTDYLFKNLKKELKPIDYLLTDKPVSLLWNIKAVKEFSRHIRLSFFVNGILDISPYYTDGGKTKREWKDPFFGFELLLNFNL